MTEVYRKAATAAVHLQLPVHQATAAEAVVDTAEEVPVEEAAAAEVQAVAVLQAEEDRNH